MRRCGGPVAFYPQGGWVTPGSVRHNVTLSDARGGEALFMPAGTWHHVRAITPSFSVSHWW